MKVKLFIGLSYNINMPELNLLVGNSRPYNQTHENYLIRKLVMRLFQINLKKIIDLCFDPFTPFRLFDILINEQ